MSNTADHLRTRQDAAGTQALDNYVHAHGLRPLPPIVVGDLLAHARRGALANTRTSDLFGAALEYLAENQALHQSGLVRTASGAVQRIGTANEYTLVYWNVPGSSRTEDEGLPDSAVFDANPAESIVATYPTYERALTAAQIILEEWERETEDGTAEYGTASLFTWDQAITEEEWYFAGDGPPRVPDPSLRVLAILNEPVNVVSTAGGKA